MVQPKKQIFVMALKIVLNLVGKLIRRIGFTRHRVAGQSNNDESHTNKTSVSISGEYRKEETNRNGNSRRS